MTRIAETFTRLGNDNRKALVIYITASDPDLDTSVEAAMAAIDAGADLLEIGVPFSDPVADGPVIQRAMHRALEAGGGFDQALELTRRVRAKTDTPIVLFGYLNPLLWQTFSASCEAVKKAGADGLLVVDLPPEETKPFREAASEHGLDWITLVAPTTSATRTELITETGSGFVYIVSMTGVTGGNLQETSTPEQTVKNVRRTTQLPACIGFGVRDETTAFETAQLADGVVVGSAVVAALERGCQEKVGAQRVGELVQALRAGVDKASHLAATRGE